SPHSPKNDVMPSATQSAAPESISALLKVSEETRMINNSTSICRFRSAIPSNPSNTSAEVTSNKPVNKSSCLPNTRPIKRKNRKTDQPRCQELDTCTFCLTDTGYSTRFCCTSRSKLLP